MSPAHTTRRSGRWAVFLACGLIFGLVLPGLYVLSYGPACWLCDEGYVSRGAFTTAYAPLHWAGDKSVTIWYALHDYSKLFVEDD
jgi:hypothetical protein